MKLRKALKQALNMVLHSKLRSWLTILGIVIGVAAVIAITSLGEGLEASINSQLSELGGDLVTITPGFSRAFGFGGHGPPRQSGGGGATATEEEVVLDRTDLQALKGLSDLLIIDTNIRGSADVYYFGKTGSTTIHGVDPAIWYQITTLEIGDGRMLGPADQNVIVIGGSLSDGFFDKPVGINQMLTIEGGVYRVVGILDDQSRSVYMPIQAAYQILDDKENGIYDSITVKVRDEDNLNETINNIQNKLMLTRHVTGDDRDFTVTSSKQQSEQRAEIISSMTAFLTAIAAVALLVGAVGIANTMFTSVLEKTKEIGIMKAIGAKNRDILLIFIFNAALIGLIGGILGIIFGTVLSAMLPTLLGGSGGITGRLASSGTLVSMNSLILAMGISIGIGVISGIIPAWQGSKLKPVDALRYE